MRTKKLTLVGLRNGKLTVSAAGGIDPRGRLYWLCNCDCGRKTTITDKALRRGFTRSCGCLSRAKPIEVSTLLQLRWNVIASQYTENDECWEWRGVRSRGGYGMVSINSRIYPVHRLALALTGYKVGDVFEGSEVAHTCDNPACCNPAHLFEATHQENHLDAVSKGRYKGHPGGRGHQALTRETAEELRRFRENGYTIQQLAVLYNIGEGHVIRVLSNRVWKELAA